METHHLHIRGIVQGVGFRPLVCAVARELGLTGEVKNGNDGVHVLFNAGPTTAAMFMEKVIGNAPPGATITSWELRKRSRRDWDDFSIVMAMPAEGERQVLIAPDRAACPACSSEMKDPRNRRFRYPFITCTACGPRYSIIRQLPYERHNTTMSGFTMCGKCGEEYGDIANRRFFSQTNSCPDCGIRLRLYARPDTMLSENTEDILALAKRFFKEGKIIAVKGTGGYLLLCDAANSGAIAALRKRKHRPAKPLAVLYPDIATIRRDFHLNSEEDQLLAGPEAPIVLLKRPPELSAIDAASIAPGLSSIGAMLPSNPLLALLAADFAQPLIATSANMSGSPVIYGDEAALAGLFEIADCIISHNLTIAVPQDDSVIQIAPHSGRKIILRRSRGLAPSFLPYRPKKNAAVVATGAFLKSTFSLAVNENMFVSQYLGSGESFEAQEMYAASLAHWLRLYDVQPETIVADLHPQYFSRLHAAEMAAQTGAALKPVQHHEAHFAAALAEHHLMDAGQPVLGVVWDGTGLGSDGNLWGGEFFRYETGRVERFAHFAYIPAIAGDKLALEPRIAALCVLHEAGTPQDWLTEKFSSAEWNNYRSLMQSTPLFTSSAGRIFDAVASLLGLCDKQSFEGEAAMYLQGLAEGYVAKNGFNMQSAYFKKGLHHNRIPTALLMQDILTDIACGDQPDFIAAKFHHSLVCLIDAIAEAAGTETLCFSGGVFQNALLVDWIHERLSGKYSLCFHKELAPNDENISFGQLAWHDNDLKSVPMQINAYRQPEHNFQQQ